MERDLRRYVLDGIPVSTNRIWRNNSRVTYLSSEYKQFLRYVAVIVGGDPLPWEWVAVDILFRPPDKRRRDVDNLAKSLLDAFTHAGLWKDDSCVVSLRITRGTPTKGGRTYVAITPRQSGFDPSPE